jgi:hypothetical protein
MTPTMLVGVYQRPIGRRAGAGAPSSFAFVAIRKQLIVNTVRGESAILHQLHCYSKYCCFDMQAVVRSCDQRPLRSKRDDKHIPPTECLERSALDLALTDASISPPQ